MQNEVYTSSVLKQNGYEPDNKGRNKFQVVQI